MIGSAKVEYDNTNDINIISMTITMNQNNNNKQTKIFLSIKAILSILNMTLLLAHDCLIIFL